MGEAAEECLIKDSAEDEPEYKTSSVSHSFRLEWNIPMKAFKREGSALLRRPIPKVLQHLAADFRSRHDNIGISKLFEFKNSKIGPFSLVLFKDSRYGTISLKLLTDPPGPELEYAFANVDDRLFLVGLSDRQPPKYMKERLLTDTHISVASKNKDLKYLTIVCGVSVVSSVSGSEDCESLVWEWSLPRELPPVRGKSWPTYSSSSGAEAFAKYSVTGQLPSLSVELATELLGVSTEEQNGELRALCVEYLMENLTPGNVAEVLCAACDNHARGLVERCKYFITKSCRVVSR